jgi:abhydrolase domain-containing protein 15
MESVWLYMGGTSLCVLATYVYYNIQRKKDQAPQLFHSNSALAQYVVENVKRLSEPFYPTIYNLHLQTILPCLLPKPKLEFDREFVSLDDGGVLALDWCVTGVECLHPNSPILLALPGLTGDKRSMSKLCKHANDNGFRACVFNKRGLGNSPLITPKMMGFGDPLDLRQAVKFIRSKYAKSEICAVGYSAGSGLLSSYLGEYGDKSDITATTYVSAGYTGHDLVRRVPRQYAFLMLRELKNVVSRHAKTLCNLIDIPTVMNATTFNEFDLEVYCKMYGYENLEEYWKYNEPMRGIENVNQPGLCINAADDPICLSECITFDLFSRKDNFLLAYTPYGGHCGFLEGWQMDSWAVKLTIEYLTAVLEYPDLIKQI